MRTMLSLAIVIGLVVPGEGQAPAKTELEGSWDAVWSQKDGGPQFKLGAGEITFVTLEFQGDKLLATHLLPQIPGREDHNPVQLVFSLNANAIPKQIDYWQPWETGKPPVRFGPTRKILASYELTGDELRMEIPVCEDTGPRPTVVSGKARCSIMLVLKRR